MKHNGQLSRERKKTTFIDTFKKLPCSRRIYQGLNRKVFYSFQRQSKLIILGLLNSLAASACKKSTLVIEKKMKPWKLKIIWAEKEIFKKFSGSFWRINVNEQKIIEDILKMKFLNSQFFFLFKTLLDFKMRNRKIHLDWNSNSKPSWQHKFSMFVVLMLRRRWFFN